MLESGPDLVERLSEPVAHVDREAAHVGHAVPASNAGDTFHALEQLDEPGVGSGDDDQDVSGELPGSPEPVVVVPADGRWQARFASEEVDRGRGR